MKTKLFLSLFLIICFGVWQSAEAFSAQQITLQVGKQAKLFNRNLTVKFVSVLNDSRCPQDVQCISAGNAQVRIKVRQGYGHWQTFDLNLDKSNSVINFRNYRIDLTNLTPYPRTNVKINRLKYRATLQITR